MCLHEQVETGPMQKAFSWEIPTEVCVDCGQWRPVLKPNCMWRDPPIPQGSDCETSQQNDEDSTEAGMNLC